MFEFAEKWGAPSLLGLLLLILATPQGQRVFERETTDAQMLQIADAALASLRSPCGKDRGRRCPVLLLAATEAFCTDEHQSPSFRAPRCAAPIEREPGSRIIRPGKPTSAISAAQKRSLWRINRTARAFRCDDGVHFRCAGSLDWHTHVVDWEGFYATFPDVAGIAGISVPVLSGSGRRAVIYVGLLCGGLCGQGRFVELEWSASGWRVVGTELLRLKEQAHHGTGKGSGWMSGDATRT